MINNALRYGITCPSTTPSTTPSTSGAGSAQSNTLAGESDWRYTLNHQKINDFFYEYRARWENIAYAFGLNISDVDAINQDCRYTKDSMKAVISEVVRRKRQAGEELSLHDIKHVLKEIWYSYCVPLEDFERLLRENPNHFYCMTTSRLKPREPENPPPAVTDNPAEIQQLTQALEEARREIAELKQALDKSREDNVKMRRDHENQATKNQKLSTQITNMTAEFTTMSQQQVREKKEKETLQDEITKIRKQLEREKQEKELVLHHVSQQQQQQTRDSVSDAPASADSHRERQGGSVVPAAAKLQPSGNTCSLIARVEPLDAGASPRLGAMTPRIGPVTPRTDAVTTLISAVTPALRDTKIQVWNLISGSVKYRLQIYWSELMHAFNLARQDFSGDSLMIHDGEHEAIARDNNNTSDKYTKAVNKMLARKSMTYGDFERVLRKLPQFTDEVNINEVIEALNNSAR